MRRRWIVCLLMACLAAGCRSPQPGGASAGSGADKSPDASKARGPVLNPRLKVETTLGDFVIELDADKAPRTTRNFMQYVLSDYYDGLIFHRVLPGVLVQTGRYTPGFSIRKEGLREGIEPEQFNGLNNARGALAMVRAPLRPRSTQAEFFVNVRDNAYLDTADGGYYVVFGHVVDGMDVVDRISAVSLGSDPRFAAGLLEQTPRETIQIHDVVLLNEYRAAALDRLIEERDREAERQAEEAVAERQRLLLEVSEALEGECAEPMTTTESGVRYCLVREGQGGVPVEGDQVLMNFRGRLPDGTVLNDTFSAGDPAKKRLPELIPGLREIVSKMREGSRYNAIIPPEQAFGQEGVPGRIPPAATILFEVELLEVNPK